MLISTAISLVAAVPAMGQTPSPAAGSVAHSFNIPAQPLRDALRQMMQQGNIQIGFEAADVDGRKSSAVSASLTASEALSRLLTGTGLTFRYLTAGSVIIEPLPRTSDGSIQLSPVRVEGTGAGRVTSEGSGSYAAQAVTVGKTAQSLREIPQSVSVISRKQMDDQDLTTVAEALDQATGVRSFGYERSESFLIRGYAANAQYDGVPQQGASSGIGDLALFDRIEVLRGPSGLLTGSGEPGGTVNYVRKRPGKEFAMSGLAGIGSWDRYRGEIDVTGSLTPSGNLRGRLVGVYQDENKFYDVGYNKDRTLYGVFEYDLTPDTVIGFGGVYARRGYINSFGPPLYSDGSLPSRNAFAGSDAESRTETSELFFDIRHDFGGGWELKGSYNRRKMDYDGFSVFPTSMVNPVTNLVTGLSAGRVEQDTKWNSFDVNVTGPVKVFGRTHELTFGANRSHNDFVGGTKFVSRANWDILNNHNFNGVIDNNVSSKYQTITVQTGAYGSARIRLFDPLTVIVGGRVSNYTSKQRNVLPSTTAWVESKATTKGKFTPYFGAVLDVNEQVSLYASYVDTFVPQTVQDVTGKALDPRVGWQGEAGVKAALFDNSLNASLAFFRLRDTNRSMVDPNNFGCGGSPTSACYRAAGEIQSQGIEAELSGSPVPGWDLTAGYTYNWQKYLSDTNASNVGKRFLPEQMPVHMVKLWSQYSFGKAGFGGDLAGLNLGAGVVAQTSMYTAAVRQGAYAVASARIGYEFSEKWEAAFNVSNLFDRKYLRIPGNPTFYNVYGEPRRFGLTVRGKF